MPLDIWLKSDDIDRNNKTSVRSEMGAAVMPSHPLNIKQFPFCVCRIQALKLFSDVGPALCLNLACLDGLGPSLPHKHFVQCLSLVQGWWQELVSPCQDDYSSQLCCLWPARCWVCTSLSGRKPLDVLCVLGEVMAGLAVELQQFGLRTCCLPTLASCCFSSGIKTTWKKAVCKFC